jgi:hypothetical protein
MTQRAPGDLRPQDAEERKLFAQEKLALDVAAALNQRLKAHKWTQRQLARELCRSEAFVSEILSGKSNMTLRTLSDVASALGGRVRVTVVTPRTVERLQSHRLHGMPRRRRAGVAAGASAGFVTAARS